MPKINGRFVEDQEIRFAEDQYSERGACAFGYTGKNTATVAAKERLNAGLPILANLYGSRAAASGRNNMHLIYIFLAATYNPPRGGEPATKQPFVERC
ncbi:MULTISPECIES: hypothetical protein [unclassified Sinorhizobium]|uniref:hypothetical protein n=1 Tax=unclassified Sinorhizobium TaxID=2613772 RepID=UPI0024C32A15|nr:MULTISPECIES: hypothetical protein [unclassified Sinorhizobium]MDK1376792.1 hypothetical protein [Sinorhizobium sp. 6-70]MDK1479563.1 hypothetical protein [Sinorhizobium sp. 6-117]